MTSTADDLIAIDTSDVDRWIGKPVGGAQLKEPVTAGDIRAWVQAMHNPNPLHYDEEFAARSIFGGLVAPQSFTLACEQQHGVLAAHAGKINGSHILWGGSEWFFEGPRIFPGDRIRCERIPFDYRITNTGFAGPTMFQRGDTIFYNQHGDTIARCRTTAVRYLLENARRLKKESASSADESGEPDWTGDALEQVQEEKHAYHRSFRERAPRKPEHLVVGEKLVRGVLGPHSIASFATEWRAYLWSRGWGGNREDGRKEDESGFQFGSGDAYRRRGALDPEQLDIIYYGQARGHLDPKYARAIGMPRPYGFGASMSCWVLDYVANWAGPYGLIIRSKYEARGPALSGDVTYLDATVTDVTRGENGSARSTLDVTMTSFPAGKLVGKATAEVEFDIGRKPARQQR